MAVLIIPWAQGQKNTCQQLELNHCYFCFELSFFFDPPRFLSWVSLFPNFPAFLICRFEIGSTLLCVIFDCWRCCSSCYFGIRFGIFFLSFGVLQGRFLVLNIAQTFLVIFEVVLWWLLEWWDQKAAALAKVVPAAATLE